MHTPVTKFSQIRKYPYWQIIFNINSDLFLKMKSHLLFFNSDGKLQLDNELYNLLKTKLEIISMFSLIIFAGISFSGKLKYYVIFLCCNTSTSSQVSNCSNKHAPDLFESQIPLQ